MAEYSDPCWQNTFSGLSADYVRCADFGDCDSSNEPYWDCYQHSPASVAFRRECPPDDCAEWYYGSPAPSFGIHAYSPPNARMQFSDPWIQCGRAGSHPWDPPTLHDPCVCTTCLAVTPHVCLGVEPICSNFEAATTCRGVFDSASGKCVWGAIDDNCPPGTHWDPICEVCVADHPPHHCWIWDSTICEWRHEEGKCYCARINRCAPCGFTLCGEELNCEWDEEECTLVCDAPESHCPNDNEHWKWSICDCWQCPPGKCWCELRGHCVDCDDPPCKEILNCEWDKATCEWVCDEPSCPEGQEFDACHACQCIPACPDGQCYCAAYGYDSSEFCIPCVTPPCANQLHCCWDWEACEWVCDDPAARCGERDWDEENCRCIDNSGPFLLQDGNGQLMHVMADADGIRFRRSDLNTPRDGWDVDTIAVDLPQAHQPRIAKFDPDDDSSDPIVHLIFRARNNAYDPYGDEALRSIFVVRSFADGEPDSWDDEPWQMLWEEAVWPDICCDPHTGRFLYSALVGTEIRGRWFDPGDDVPQDEFTMMDEDGVTPLVSDDMSRRIEPAEDEPGFYTLTMMSGGDTIIYESTDDGLTWKEVWREP